MVEQSRWGEEVKWNFVWGVAGCHELTGFSKDAPPGGVVFSLLKEPPFSLSALPLACTHASDCSWSKHR